jgi:hypothetical protein
VSPRDPPLRHAGGDRAGGGPLVLSRTPTLEAHFTGGTVFAENTPGGLRAAILDALARKDALAAAMAELVRRYRAEGEARVEEVRGMVRLG